MRTTFLGQGMEKDSSNAVGYHLLDSLDNTMYHTFFGISAFASKSGIEGLANHIENVKNRFRSMTLVVGVDQQGTSKEALLGILDMNIDGYVFYQREPNTIFHPKIYLFEGENDVKLIVGSSNLTSRGLFVNVESSLLIEFERNDPSGTALLVELKEYYKTFFSFSDPNLLRIDANLIDYLSNEGIIEDEKTIRQIHDKTKAESKATPQDEQLSSIIIPKRETASIPPIFRRSTLPTKSKTNSASYIENIEQKEVGQLLWQSGPLTKRDLNIKESTSTNPTGSMLFKKGRLTDIDQRHYFREVIFADLPWVNDVSPSTAHLERATAFFNIIIEGKDCGTYPLILTHNSRTDTKTYLQNNSMTQVSWGKAKEIVAKDYLIGKTVSLIKIVGSSSNIFILSFE